jgi:hypothetical protein
MYHSLMLLFFKIVYVLAASESVIRWSFRKAYYHACRGQAKEKSKRHARKTA